MTENSFKPSTPVQDVVIPLFWTPWKDNVPADFINDIGVKFWRDRDLQRYAVIRGVTGVQCMFVQTPDGSKSRIVSRGPEVLHESPSMESGACFLDALWMLRQ